MSNLKLINLTLLSHFKTKIDELLEKKVNKTDIATTEQLGLIKPDGNTVFVDENGVLSSVGGSGGSGTNNYENLINKPKINGVELTGDLSSESLGLSGGDSSPETITGEGSSYVVFSDIIVNLSKKLEQPSEYSCELNVLSDSITDISILIYYDNIDGFLTHTFNASQGINNVNLSLSIPEGISNVRFVATYGCIISAKLTILERMPYLTSNNTELEDGTYIVSGSTLYQPTNYDYYKPFMENNNCDIYDAWHPTQGVPQWLMLELPVAKCISSFVMYNRTSYTNSPHKVRFEGSNDGETWDIIKEFIFSESAQSNVSHEEIINHPVAYSKYRWYIESAWGDNYGVISKIDLYFMEDCIYKEFIKIAENNSGITVMTQDEFDAATNKTSLGIVGICNLGCLITSLYDCSRWSENAYIYKVATTSTDGYTASIKISKLSLNLGTEVDTVNYLYSDVKDISSTFDNAFTIIYNSALLSWQLTALVNVEDVETGMQYSANDVIATWQYSTTYNKQFKMLQER